MEQLPNCPKCNSEYTYEDGSLLVCPECAYEWSASEANAAEEANVIKDANGNVIIENVGATRQVYSENTAKEMADILKGVLTRGTGVRCRMKNHTAAAKTGTTNDNKDGWFCGYTAQYTTAVWVGLDIPQAMEDLSGSTFPGQIWKTFMEDIHEGLENQSLNQ